MLDSKVDKQIKRYLKSISDKKNTQSKVNGSCHYFMTTERGTFEVRFANHFAPSGDRADFDIVKVRDLYIIRFGEIQYSLYEEDVLTYIKALFLVGPEMSKQLEDAREQARSYLNKMNYYKSKWTKYQEDVKFMNDIWAEKEKTDVENIQLSGENKQLKNNNEVLKSELKNIKALIKGYKNTAATSQSNYNKLFRQFSEAKKLLNNIDNLKNIINKIEI